jgi:hypothetical protein
MTGRPGGLAALAFACQAFAEHRHAVPGKVIKRRAAPRHDHDERDRRPDGDGTGAVDPISIGRFEVTPAIRPLAPVIRLLPL